MGRGFKGEGDSLVVVATPPPPPTHPPFPPLHNDYAPTFSSHGLPPHSNIFVTWPPPTLQHFRTVPGLLPFRRLAWRWLEVVGGSSSVKRSGIGKMDAELHDALLRLADATHFYLSDWGVRRADG